MKLIAICRYVLANNMSSLFPSSPPLTGGSLIDGWILRFSSEKKPVNSGQAHHKKNIVCTRFTALLRRPDTWSMEHLLFALENTVY